MHSQSPPSSNDTRKPTVNDISIEWLRTSRLSILDPYSLPRLFPGPTLRVINTPMEDHIAVRVRRTSQRGAMKLWDGYGENDATRKPSLVSSQTNTARFFYLLARTMRPKRVLEFGSAFGLSGMYWLAALKENKRGHLYSYEVNSEWAAIARDNLQTVSPRFTLTNDLFENAVDTTLGSRRVAIAFIDGVHTSEWVLPQYHLVKRSLRPGGVMIFDDITFSDDMRDCWSKIAAMPGCRNVAVVNNRIGIVQLYL